MILKKITINNFLKLIMYFVAIPLVLIIRAISPLLLIRWCCTQSTRIGHYSENVQIYIAMKEKKMNFQSNRRYFDIFFDRSVVCNYQLQKMWLRSKKIFFLPNWFMQPISDINEYVIDKIINSNNLHDIGYYYVPGKIVPGGVIPVRCVDTFNSLQEANIPVHFTDSEKKKGDEILKKIGINQNDQYVMLALRGEEYLKKKYPNINWGRHSTRDTNISYYNETINFLVKKKFKVILIGSGSPKNLENKNSYLINYENSKFKSEFMDIYLFSKKRCKFVVSSATGIDAIGTLFKKPILEIVTPISDGRTYSNTYSIIFKKYYSRTLNRNLTLREIFDLNLSGLTGEAEELNEIKIIHPTSNEILNSAEEVLNKIENNYVSNTDNKNLQKEFTLKYKYYIDKHAPHRFTRKHTGMITESFISENKYLLN